MIFPILSLLLTILIPWRPVIAQQPKVTTIERLPARRSNGILTIPDGTAWCQGQPTVWMPGHKNFLEDRPSCRLPNGTWTQDQPGKAVMDISDELNRLDDPTVIDRHECGALDVNDDGILDIYCLVGANVGKGVGFNELYLGKKDGSIRKVKRHGLQRFNTLRTRHTTILKDANGTEMVYISGSFLPREDGRLNKHVMFRKNGKNSPRWKERFFDYVDGPWHTNSKDTCALTIDANQDGLDDLLVCNREGPAFLFVQTPNGTFLENPWTTEIAQRHWSNARVADFTGDGIPDLAVLRYGFEESSLKIFEGTRELPYFKFTGRPYYEKRLRFAAPDLEVLDANGDGIMDLYVVLDDQRTKEPDGTPRTEETYCAGKFNPSTWWPLNKTSYQTPPVDWIPPRDIARDILFLGNNTATKRWNRFTRVKMKHAQPGCGAKVKKFGERSLVLTHGGFERPGHQVFLEWM